jgi:hypothetical protein
MPTFIDGYEQLELFKEDEMAKVLKNDHNVTFAQGGSGKMFGKGTAGPAEEGVSGKSSNDMGGGEWAKGGGSNRMFGKGHAGKKVPGVSGKQDQSG